MPVNEVTTVSENPAEIRVDRETASRINPLISSIWTEDTLDLVAAVVSEVGHMIAETEMAKEHIYAVFGAAAAALEWERDNIKSLAQAQEKGATV